MEFSLFKSLFGNRRSIRRYTNKPLKRELVEELLEAAICAPSAHNRQPWRFAVLQSSQPKHLLARAMGDMLRSDRMSDGDRSEIIERDVSRSYSRITQASSVVVVCLTMSDMDIYPDARRSRSEYIMAVQGTAMAAQNLLLAAHAHALGSCWMCAPLFCPDTVRKTLSLPKDWFPHALVTLGYPDEAGKVKDRRPLSDVAIWK